MSMRGVLTPEIQTVAHLHLVGGANNLPHDSEMA